MNHQKFATLFPVGSHLCREPMPAMSELIRDMENLKRHGFNLIKLQESWLTDEPEEGHYDFSVSEELIAHAAKLDMGVYFGLSMEHAPAWLWQKYPDSRMIARDGNPMLYEAQLTIPADGKPGPCFDDPGAMQAQLRFIDKLVRTLGKHENIVVWNTWQEMGYEGERLTGQKVCYCPNTLRAFQRWLQQSHGTLKNLNHSWKSRYTRWEDVVPNRDVGKFCLPNSIAYEYFLDNIRIADILRARAETIKAADPLGRPVFAHQGSSTVGSGVDWSFAKAQDFLGCSCYPAWFHLHDWDDIGRIKDRAEFRHQMLLNEIWESVALKFDYLRSCNAQGSPLWGAEFQGGAISTGLYKGRIPSPEDIRRWMLTAVGSGVNAISFWVTRAEIQGHEINGYSLLDSAGDSTPRYEEASKVAAALNRHAKLFGSGNIKQAQVAIVVNEWNYKLLSQLKGNAEEHLMYATRGWHRLFWEQGIQVDFVEVGQLEEEFVKNYKLLVLPMPLSISEQVATQLQGYVRQGGCLLSEACPGRFDSSGFGNRGELSKTMAELFGVAQSSLTLVEEPQGGERWRMHSLGYGDYLDSCVMEGCDWLTDVQLTPNLYLTTFEIGQGKALMTAQGGCCAVERTLDQGTALLFGSFLGHSGTAYRSEMSAKFVQRLTDKLALGVAYRGQMLVRELARGDECGVVVTNPQRDTVTEQLELPAGCTAAITLFGEKLVCNNGTVTISLQPLDMTAIIFQK